MTQLESMPMWLGTMSLASRIPRCAGPVAQVRVGRLATEVVGDPVVVERVGRGDGVGVAAHPLDPLRGLRALPQADEPQPGDAPVGEPVELLVRDRVERADVAPVAARQLVEPDVRALGQQDEPRHPGRVARERLGLVGRCRRTIGPSRAARPDRRRRHRHRRSGDGAPSPPRRGCRSPGRSGRTGRRGRCRAASAQCSRM